MPLVAAVVVAYAAGLLAGYGSAALFTLGAAALVVWWGGRSSRDRLALTLVAAAGFATAGAARKSDAACLTQLLAATEWRVELQADAAPGAFVPARPACGPRVSIAVTSGKADAATTVVASGTVTRGRNSALMTDAKIRVVERANVLARWRAMIGRGIDARFGTDAPLVRALLVADMRQLSPTLRDRYSAAGLSHMLSVSGLHVGLIAVAVSLVAQIIGLPKTRSDAFVVSLTALYVLVIGAPLPAVRAAVMLGVASLSVATQRPTSAWAVLAVSALVPLLDSAAVLDIGFQLSMAGMVALVASGALTKRSETLSQGGWRGTLYRSLVASTAATLLTAPLVAAVFGRISFVAPITNLVAVPVMALLQPMLFLAMVLLPVSTAAQFVADACRPLIFAVDYVASVGATLPGSTVTVLTDGTSAALAYAAAAAFVVAAVSRFPGRALLAAAVCVVLIAWRPLVPAHGAQTELHMIDVGQGDAIALRTTRGNWVLFDAGRDWEGGDAGKRDVVPYISSRGGRMTAFVLSHAHSDHVGGAASAIATLSPERYIDPGFAGGSWSYRNSLVQAQRQRTRWSRVRVGDSLVVDEAVITWLGPDSAWADRLSDANDASTVARIRVGDVTILMTGDAEKGEEEWLLANQRAFLEADILKVAHHGSNTSSTDAFLDAVRPRLALVSVGAGNMYRHPSASVLDGLATRGVVTMRTDQHGSLIVRTDGRRIEVEARGERFSIER